MKWFLKKSIAFLLLLTLLTALLPDSYLISESLAAEQYTEPVSESGPVELPVQHISQLQQNNAEATSGLLDGAGTEEREGDFIYRVLEDGTAAVTGYCGSSSSVILPLSLNGAAVVAISDGAFSRDLQEIRIHGNVSYIADNALPAGTEIAAWQGSYAASWAQQHGYSLNSLTEGVLFDGVKDMTDVLSQMSILSESLISLEEVAARRLAVGNRFVVNHGDDDEQFFTVTAKRHIGKRVYITVNKTDFSEIYSHRVYEGTRTETRTFTGGYEKGVGSADGEIKAASEVMERPPYSEEDTESQSTSIPIKKFENWEVEFGYSLTTTVTSAYSVVVDNGKVISGTMSTEQEDQNSFFVKIKYKGKIWSMKGGLVGAPLLDPLKRDLFINFLKDLKGIDHDKPLGSWTFYFVPAIGLGIEISAKFGWQAGGSGSVDWTSRILCTYDYIPSKNDWGLRERRCLSKPSPVLTGSAFFKVSFSLNMKIICGWITSQLQFSCETGVEGKLEIPLEENACLRSSVTIFGKLSLEAGFWFSALGWDIQLATAGKTEFTLFSVTASGHVSTEQGFHLAAKCTYSPMDYSIRYITGTEWQPPVRCYLKDNTYTYFPVELEVCTLETSGVFKTKDPDPLYEFKNISFNYSEHPDALEGIIIQPQPPNTAADQCVRWCMVEPSTGGQFYWDDKKTVEDNLKTALNKTKLSQEDLPNIITLEAEWSNKYQITYDANGGRFPDNAGANNVLVKYYAPGEIVIAPSEQPLKTLSFFSGWSLDREGTQPWFGGSEINENLTVFAQYVSFDPTDHTTINARYGSTPTLIGNVLPLDCDRVDWTLTVNNQQPGIEQLNQIMQNGIFDYDGSGNTIGYNNAAITNCIGQTIMTGDEAIGFAFTDVVNPSLTYNDFVIPSTLNGLPVVAERGFLQKLKARRVIFAATPRENMANTIKTDDYLFSGNTYVQTVYMDSTKIIKLGDYAFNGCTNLVSVTLPGTLQKIGNYAFQGCTGLTKASLGIQVDTVGQYAFKDCVNLTELTVDTPYMISMTNAFRDSADTPAHILMTLGDHVHVLPTDAFRGCSALLSMTVTDTPVLSEIGESAFHACTGLRTAVLERIEGTSRLKTIGKTAFAGTSLTEMEIPASVTSFYTTTQGWTGYTEGVFYSSPIKKITIGGAGGITTISPYMFLNIQNGSTLQELVLREGVTAIANKAFFNSSGSAYQYLQKVKIPTSLTTIGEYAFNMCQSLKYFGTDPDNQKADLVLGNKIQSISKYAFSNCAFTSLILESSVQTINEGAFSINPLGWVKLNEGLKTIWAKAFATTYLTDVEIPASVTTFYTTPDGFTGYSSNVFSNTPIKKITIGGEGGITTIYPYMFCNTSGKATLEELVLRKGVTTIANNAFFSSSGSTYENLWKITYPDTLVTIGSNAFCMCGGLKCMGTNPDYQEVSLVLSGGVKTIGSYAFRRTAFTSAILESSVQTISEGAFFTCPLSQITLSEGLKTIGAKAFGSTSLTEIKIPASVTSFYTTTEGWTGYSNNVFYNTPIRKISIGGANGITTIWPYMFANIQNGSTLQELVIQEGVTSVAAKAFWSSSASSYTNLRQITIPTSLTSIGSYAFAACPNLKKLGTDPDGQEADLVLGNRITQTGMYAFSQSGFTSAILESSVQTINEGAFMNSPLNRIRLSKGLKAIHKKAFAQTSLTEIEIPASVNSFFTTSATEGWGGYSDNVFCNTRIRKITIGGPNGITTIWPYMFANIQNGTTLQELVLREGVTTLAKKAFFSSSDSYSTIKKMVIPSTLIYLYDLATQGLNQVTYYCVPGKENSLFNYVTEYPEITATFVYPSDEEPLVLTVEAFSMLTEPVPPSREGYIFLGWYPTSSERPWDFSKDRLGYSNISLYPHWAKESVNGIYRIDGDHAILLSYSLEEGESTAVFLPQSWQEYPVTAIADGAFSGEPITSLTLPKDVQGLSANTFAGAEDLIYIRTVAGSPAYVDRNGILFTADGTRIIYCPPGQNLKSYTVPSGVISIGPDAFRGQSLLTSLTFTEGLKEIGRDAFRDCSSLTTLTLPQSLLTIGAGAFFNCSSLNWAKGANNCNSIGDNAFASTGFSIFYGPEGSALVRYAVANGHPWNIYTVTAYVDGTSAWTARVQAGTLIPAPQPTVPDGRVLVNEWFTDPEMKTPWDFATGLMPMGYPKLYAATVPVFETEKYIYGEISGYEIVGYNGSDMEITIPQSIGSYYIYSLNADAFPPGCILHLPNDLFSIDVDSFVAAGITLYATETSDTESLLIAAGYTPPPVVHTLSFVTNGGSLLDSIQIAAGSEVSLPTSVRDSCTLSAWCTDQTLDNPVGAPSETYTMPDEDTTLYAAWEGTAPVYSFLWEQAEDHIVITGSKKVNTVSIPATINGMPVLEIAKDAFSNDSKLTALSLPEGLKTIADFGFSGSGLTAVTLPSTLESIGTYAFSNCTKLTEFNWPAAISALPAGVFSGDKALASLTLPENLSAIGANALEDCQSLTSLILPDSVTTVGRAAFRNMSGLESLTLGRNTVSIPDTTLDGCVNLMTINVADGNTAYVSVDGVLYYTDRAGLARYPAGLTQDDYSVDPSAMMIEAHAFADASHLTELTLPEELVSVGAGSFKRCSALQAIDIPDSVNEIGAAAFDTELLLISGENTTAQQYARQNGLKFRLRNVAVVPAEAISGSMETLTLMKGYGYTFTAEISPVESTDELLWFSENRQILRVFDGYLWPVNPGETELSVCAGDAILTVPVRVVDQPYQIMPETGLARSNQPLQLSIESADNYTPSGIVLTVSEGASLTEDWLLQARSTGMVTVHGQDSKGAEVEQIFACIGSSETFNLPAALREIEQDAFRNLPGLTKVILPDTVRSVGDHAFADCTGLVFVYIPSVVQSVSSSAFSDSPNVTVVCHKGSPAAEALSESNTNIYLVP